MNKAELRRIYQEERQKLTEEEIEQLSRQICRQFFLHVNLERIRHIHIFLPITQQKEVNTWLIIRKLQEAHPHIGLVVSRTNWKERRMESFHLRHNTVLKESKLGIPEPVDAEHCPPEKIDLVLLPLLAFDHSGNRVGYGAGFYDRFLSGCHKKAQKIGLSLFGPSPELISDVDRHDIPMDACICPDKVYYLKSNS